jgi:acetolactate synthase-1/2/3 large subunit
MLRTRQAAKAIRAVAHARSFTTTSAVASVQTSKKVASHRNQSTAAAAPARDIPSPGFNVEKNQNNVQPLVNPRKNDMDESYATLQLRCLDNF